MRCHGQAWVSLRTASPGLLQFCHLCGRGSLELKAGIQQGPFPCPRVIRPGVCCLVHGHLVTDTRGLCRYKTTGRHAVLRAGRPRTPRRFPSIHAKGQLHTSLTKVGEASLAQLLERHTPYERSLLSRIKFFPTIEYSDWRTNPRLAPLLPLDAAGNADDRSVPDFFAMLRELQPRRNEACRDLGKNPPGSKDTLFDAYLWAMERVGDYHFHLMDPSVNQWDAWADTAFWQARMGGLAANCRIYCSQGSTLNRILKASQKHPVVLKFETWLLGQLISNQQGESETATDQTMDLVAQVTHPHQVTRKWDAANCNLAMGLRGGKQINQEEPIAVMGCERNRFEWLLGETHGCMPPERLEMRWTNTFFSQDMDLSREDQQQSNEQQVAAGQPEVSFYSRHAHSLLWPEKITNERLIGRKVVRHADPSLCTPGIQSRLLFMRTHVLGQVAGWLWAGIKGR